MSEDIPNEETQLLPRRCKKKPTPLPKVQISIVLLLLLAEPITSICIYPFINNLVSELGVTGGDETKVGYYAGLIESLFFVAEAFTVLQWSRLSDRIGRRPVVLTGIAGVSLSMVCFGLSTTFWRLVVSRCLAGFLNGNIGVLDSMMGDLTDSTNIAQGSALIPIVWSFGSTVGPLIGGQLSHPFERFPDVFGGFKFWKRYPYFLPCAVSAAYSATMFFVTFFFMKEPESTMSSNDKVIATETETNGRIQNVSESQQRGETAASHVSPPVGPLPLQSVMTPRVLITMLNYSILVLIDAAFRALQPLFFATSTELGGLGMSPPTIGLLIGASGLLNGAFQALFFSPIYRRFGIKRVFLTGMCTFVPVFATFPLINFIARHQGMSFLTWSVLALQLLLAPVAEMTYSCCFLYINTSSPNRKSLGATNGLAQTASSIVRAIAPASATSLFALSIQYNLLGGWFVYYVLLFTSLIGLPAISLLPRDVWKDEHDD